MRTKIVLMLTVVAAWLRDTVNNRDFTQCSPIVCDRVSMDLHNAIINKMLLL